MNFGFKGLCVFCFKSRLVEKTIVMIMTTNINYKPGGVRIATILTYCHQYRGNVEQNDKCRIRSLDLPRILLSELTRLL
jgi:hypothetical protein